MWYIAIHAIKYYFFAYLVFYVIKRTPLHRIYMLHRFLLFPRPEYYAGNTNTANRGKADDDYDYGFINDGFILVFLILLDGVDDADFVVCSVVNGVELLKESNTNNPSRSVFIFLRLIIIFLDSQLAIDSCCIVHLNNSLPWNDNRCVISLGQTI